MRRGRSSKYMNKQGRCAGPTDFIKELVKMGKSDIWEDVSW